jgi:hypothetical protein
MVLIDLQPAERPAMVVSLRAILPGALQILRFEGFLRKHPTVSTHPQLHQFRAIDGTARREVPCSYPTRSLVRRRARDGFTL